MAPKKDSDTLATPVIVEEDGWTLASGSSDRPTEDKLREALGGSPEAPPPPPKREPAPEPEPQDEPEPTEPEPTETEPTEEEPEQQTSTEEPTAVAKRRRTHDPQKRIDRYHRDLQTEREKTARLERELADLRAGQRQPATAPPPAAAAPPPESTLGPKPTWGGPEGFEAQGRSWEEYEEAKELYQQKFLQHEVQTAIAAERSRFQTETAQHQADAAFIARIDALRAKRPDYDEVVEQLGNLDSPILKHLIYYSQEGPAIGLHLAEHLDQAEALASMQFSRPIVDTIRRSPVPVKLLEHFALHPEEVQTLIRLDPVSAIAAIGRLEARLDVGQTVTTAAARPVTSARPPLRTVSGGAPISRTPSPTAPANDIPFSPEYIQRANEEEALASRRRRGF